MSVSPVSFVTPDAVVWRPYYITLPGNVPRSKYRHAMFNGVVVVLDYDGPKSVADDAERVAREMYAVHGNAPIVYCAQMRDERCWTELGHMEGVFIAFRVPCREGMLAITAAQPFLP